MNRKKLLPWAALAIACAAGPVCAEVSEDRVKALEARLAQLEGENSARAKAEAGALDKLKVNGFLSAGMGYADVDDFSYLGLYDAWSHDDDGVVGVQLDGRINDRMRAVLQLVGRGGGNFSVSTEWAYLGWRATDNGEIRAGRQRLPFFTMSEYIEVGYAYPWARPPVEVYLDGMPQAYNGVSYNQTLTAGSWSHDMQVYWGSSEFPAAGGLFLLEDVRGASIRSTRGDWSFNLNYSSARSTFGNPLFDALTSAGQLAPLSEDTAWFGGVGMQYDNGNLLVLAEANQIRVHGYFPDTDEHYVTVGWHFDKVTPHLTWAVQEIKDRADRVPDPALCGAGIPLFCLPDGSLGMPDGAPDMLPGDALVRMLETPQTSVALGVRYDFLPNAAIKADWTRVLDTEDTFGNFSRVDGNTITGAMQPDDVDLYRIVVDVVF